MDLMAIRRRLLMQSVQQEQWDYVILPFDGKERGRFPVTKIQMEKDQKATVYFDGIKSRSAGHMLIDGYLAGASYVSGPFSSTPTGTLCNCSMLDADSGTIVLTAGKNGTITIGNSRTASEGTSSPYDATIVKVRIE